MRLPTVDENDPLLPFTSLCSGWSHRSMKILADGCKRYFVDGIAVVRYSHRDEEEWLHGQVGNRKPVLRNKRSNTHVDMCKCFEPSQNAGMGS
jgi:hypothetical protein